MIAGGGLGRRPCPASWRSTEVEPRGAGRRARRGGRPRPRALGGPGVQAGRAAALLRVTAPGRGGEMRLLALTAAVLLARAPAPGKRGGLGGPGRQTTAPGPRGRGGRASGLRPGGEALTPLGLPLPVLTGEPGFALSQSPRGCLAKGTD